MAKQHTKRLDTLDNVLLYLISIGGDSLSYLCAVLDVPKSTMNNRITRLASMKLVDSIDNSQRWQYRKYVLTTEGQELVSHLDILSNIIWMKRA